MAQENYIPHLLVKDFHFELPAEKIADFPTAQRDGSRLLIADGGTIRDARFYDIISEIQPNSTLVMNESKVISARLPMQKPTGGAAEVLLLAPVQPADPALALSTKGTDESLWNAMIGGRKIPAQTVLTLQHHTITLQATVMERAEKAAMVQLRWQPESLTLAHILEQCGNVPLPPYIKREAVEQDKERYQTVYAKTEGSVAAPTAGLHFTDGILTNLKNNNVHLTTVTLHVGAGTFRPLETETVAEHPMHEELFAVPLSQLEELYQAAIRREQTGAPIIAVGTTSMRTLESLYWLGVHQIMEGSARNNAIPRLEQWTAYRLAKEYSQLPSASEAFAALKHIVRDKKADHFTATTGLLIAPGYTFGVCDRLITNFHQPDSTLLLLVAAFVGTDMWRNIYTHALGNGYRFLSYGDSSLLTPIQK
jgi:S-adenosylmethionine:tRNA ribosyltransferase-isomerase